MISSSNTMASRLVQVQQIWNRLGAEKAKALPAFHAFSWALTLTARYNTGRFSRMGKDTWFKVYTSYRDVIQSLQLLSDATDVTSQHVHAKKVSL